jgi:hypothetical protein
MKITKEQLKKIISEEMENVVEEGWSWGKFKHDIGLKSPEYEKKLADRASADDAEMAAADRASADDAEMAANQERMAAQRAKWNAEDKEREDAILRRHREKREKARENRPTAASAKPSGDSRVHTAPGGWARKSSLDHMSDIGRFEENRLAKEDLIAIIREEIQDILKD